MSNLIELGGVAIHADKNGRYSLNDLHRAAGGENRHRPSLFTENQQAKELAQEIGKAGIPALVSVKGGRAAGTYGAKEMVYAYAMWVSPAFNLQVIRAYDALATGAVDEAIRIAQRTAARQAARLEAPALTDAVRHIRTAQGKEVEHYHFSNEFDLINRVALGMSAKQFRLAHGLGPEDSIRDQLTTLQIKCVEHLQRHNAALIEEGMTFEERKASLNRVFLFRHSAALMSEFQRLEA